MPFVSMKNKNLRNTGIVMLIYGESGVGKTSLLRCLDGKNALVLDVDSGMEPCYGLDITVEPLPANEDGKGLIEFKRIVDDLKSGHKDYKDFKTIVIDNASELEKFFQFSIRNYAGKKTLQIQHYGQAAEKMREYLRYIRDLKENGINIIWIAHEKFLATSDDTGNDIQKLYPKLSDKLSPEICGFTSMVARLEMNVDGKRLLRLDPQNSPLVTCKNFSANGVSLFSDTLDVDWGTDEKDRWDITKIFKHIYESQTKPKTKGKK